MLFRRTWGMGLIGLVCVVLIPIHEASAESNLRLGVLELHPIVRFTEKFDDNVCRNKGKDCSLDANSDGIIQTEEREEGRDSISVLSPGVLVRVPVRDHMIEGLYRSEIARYRSLKDENYEDHWIQGTARFLFPIGFGFAVDDEWTQGHDHRQAAQNGQLDFFRQNTLVFQVKQEVGSKLNGTAQYSLLSLDYDEARNRFRDRSERQIAGTLFYGFLPKTSVLLEYNNADIEYDEEIEPLSRDNTVARLLGGIAYDISEKSNGDIRVGYEKKKFKEREDYSGIVLSVGVEHQFRRKTHVRINAERGSEESNLGGSSTEKGQDYSISGGGSLTLDYQFTGKISGQGGFSYWRDQYRDEQVVLGKTDTRIDETWGFVMGLDYRIRRWLNVFGRFDFERRGSSFDQFEYRNTVYSTGIEAAF